MALNSFAFLFAFLPFIAIGVHLLRDFRPGRAAQLLVLAGSLAFYAASGPRYLPVLLLSVAFNWAVGRVFDSAKLTLVGRKRLLLFGLAVNVLLLCFFKYVNFFLSMLMPLTGRSMQFRGMGFPLGVSFFTVTQVMYLVDRYERLIPASSLLDHATFVSFFHNVTAGPLERAKSLVGQLGNLGSLEDRDDRLARGIAFIAMGLFKKVVLADSFARVTNAGYAHVESLSTLGAWITSLSYAFQIYFDFSGYSDMALGAAKLLGIDIIQNFNAPYRAKNISEFWQRWHISLSKFITTYLYTPIVRGMGRVTVHKSNAATLLAMTIAGLWHGPAWTFVLWGTFHGLGLGVYQYWKRLKRPLPTMAAVLVTFLFVNVGLVLFRAPSVGDALGVTIRLWPGANLLGLTDLRAAIPSVFVPMLVPPLIIGSIIAFAGPTSTEIAERMKPSFRAGALILLVVAVSLTYMLAGTQSEFVYRAF